MLRVAARTVSVVVIEIDDPLDPRLADYRGLRERRKESDEYFIVEGLTAIERLLTSPYPVRSVLLTPATLARLADRLDGVTTYVISAEAMSAVAGVNLHRGAVASAARLPSPSLADGAAGCAADRDAGRDQRPREPRRDRPHGTRVGCRCAAARPDVRRPVLPAQRARLDG